MTFPVSHSFNQFRVWADSCGRKVHTENVEFEEDEQFWQRIHFWNSLINSKDDDLLLFQFLYFTLK